jgi:hypothetical protein
MPIVRVAFKYTNIFYSFKNTQIGIFGMKMHHLATLAEAYLRHMHKVAHRRDLAYKVLYTK